MKIVIVSRTIFPLLSPRAFRATELAKQFARLGHDVSLYAVTGKYDYTNFCKETGVKVKPIKMRLGTADSEGKVRYNFFDKIAYHAFGDILEYPDIEFCWKIPVILKKEPNTDLLVTVAVPHPIHWGAAIARKILKERFPKVWVSDCGDPYMGNGVGKKHPFYFKWVEKFWGNQTDFVSIPISSARKAYYSNVQDKIRVIPQGFNMENVRLSEYRSNAIPSFAYAGSVYPGLRDPSTLLDFLCTVDAQFRFTVFTNNASIYEPYKSRLGDKLIIHSFIPRDELLLELSKQDFLINLINPNHEQSPSKLIDYYLSKRPILDISTPFNEKVSLLKALAFKLDNWHTPKDISLFDIRNVADAFIKLVD